MRIPDIVDDDTSLLRRALWSGSCASALSLASLVLLGRRTTSHWCLAPNAISHWLWGRRALHKRGLSLGYTAIGIVIHHAASVFWALFFEAFRRKASAGTTRTAIATSAVACLVDFRLTPQRLTPGFEHHLTKKDLAVVYACFATGLMLSRKLH